MKRDDALKLMVKWAKAAEACAYDFPHISSADQKRVTTAAFMAEMWAKVAEQVEEYPLYAVQIDDRYLPGDEPS